MDPLGDLSTVVGNEPLKIETIGHLAYPQVPAVQGDELGYDMGAGEKALAYASSVLGKEAGALEVLSAKWSSAVVLQDATGAKVYKVFRRATGYNYVEKEMAMLAKLHAIELAPRPYLLVDADEAYRADPRGKRDDTINLIEEIPIARQNCNGRNAAVLPR